MKNQLLENFVRNKMEIMKNFDILVRKLATCYFRGSLEIATEIEQSDVSRMTWDWQEKFLEVTMKNELLKLYPLSNEFSKLFFKCIINYLVDQEVHDDMYAHLCRFMNTHPTDNYFSYRHYIIGNNFNEIITIKETNKTVADGTTGLRNWEAGPVLADWAICNKDIFSSKKVLELGAGVGFSGLTIAKHCNPKSMYLTDYHHKVLDIICDNININFPHMDEENDCEEILYKNDTLKLGVTVLDWNAIENLSSNIIPDVIIGSDIVYDPTLIDPLCEVLKTFFDRNNQLNVYITSFIRNENTYQKFLNSLDSMNFNVEELHLKKYCVFIDWDLNIKKSLLHISS